MSKSRYSFLDAEILKLVEVFTINEVIANLQPELKGLERKVFYKYLKRNWNRFLDDNEGVYDAAESVNTDYQNVPFYWDKTSKERSVFVRNPNYETPATAGETEIDFLNIFKNVQPFEYTPQPAQNTALFDRLVLSDIHIGMDVNKDGYALYDGKWSENELFERLNIVLDWVLLHRKSKTLLIHELGDYLDGFDAMTTRGGHSLPQNMDNQQMFDVGLKWKIALIDALIPYYQSIEVINICNDNHAGSFGYIVNSAFKSVMQLKYPDVIVKNQRKFIDHYINENRCFVLTHGKDDKSLKFGFKPQLDAAQVDKIKNYIDEYKLYNYICEFSKGDSHQLMTDSTTSSAFEYQNFGAFSPPSDWVKTNFKNTLSCFTFFNYYENQKSINNYIFDKQ